MVPVKLTSSEANKLVELALTKIALVEVTAVPEAEVKNNGPARVPPASGR